MVKLFVVGTRATRFGSHVRLRLECLLERPCCQIQESLISLHGVRFTFVTLSLESCASGPILWSHYLILRLVEWCWVLKPEGVMWERFRLHKHALLLLRETKQTGCPSAHLTCEAFSNPFLSVSLFLFSRTSPAVSFKSCSMKLSESRYFLHHSKTV